MPTIKIEQHDRGWIVLLQADDGYPAYLHTDGRWRQSTVGPIASVSGFHHDEHNARHALSQWCAAIPHFTVGKHGIVKPIHSERDAALMKRGGRS